MRSDVGLVATVTVRPWPATGISYFFVGLALGWFLALITIPLAVN